MKVSPPSSPMPAKEHVNESQNDNNSDTTNNCSKRRRLHSQTNIIINGHYRHRKHIYPRDEDKSSSMDCFDAISNSVNGNSNSSFNSSNSGEDASDCDDSSMMLSSYPNQQQHPTGETSSPHHNKKDGYRQTAIFNHISCNNEEDYTTSAAIRNAVQQLSTNSDNSITLSLSTHSEKNKSEPNNITHELTVSTRSDEHPIKSETITEKNLSAINTDFDDPAITANDCINSEISNDECLSQSPLNLTRSQGSSEGGNKSEDEDEGDYYDETEVKNGFGNDTNEDESVVNGHSLPTTEVPFPWNIALGNNSNNNKQKHQNQDDKVTAQPPQLLLTSGHLTTGCLQAAQLLIPTARGIMSQTILAIPINDMVSSAITSTSNQQHLQQQLLYHSTNNVGQQGINRQQLNQTCQPSLPLPLSRYFQQQQTSAADDAIPMTGTNDNADNNNYDAMSNDGTISADQYNNIQQRKWQSPDLACKTHSFISPQQKLLPRAKNGESHEFMNATHRSKESSTILSPASTSADCRIYSTNNSASITTAMTPMSPPPPPPPLRRNGSNNGGGVDVIQRQTVWPTAVTTADHHNGGDDNDNEGDKHQHPSHTSSSASTTSSTNINILKSLAPPASKLNCNIKPPKDEDSAAAAVAAAAYNQQNAICTALATHMLCASQLAAAQQPMFDSLDNGNAVKKSNHLYNNNNNNSLKSNNMMNVVNPAVLEKWMMEERYYYNNNNNNNKNIAGSHNHHQRYNAAAAAAAAAAAVELLSSGVSASSGGGADSLASCKKRKRRTSFTPHALELLNGHFERNTHPSGSEITGLAHRLGYEREVIRIWFCNKRQALKNTVRTITGNGPTHMTSTKSHNNTSGY